MMLMERLADSSQPLPSWEASTQVKWCVGPQDPEDKHTAAAYRKMILV